MDPRHLNVLVTGMLYASAATVAVVTVVATSYLITGPWGGCPR